MGRHVHREDGLSGRGGGTEVQGRGPAHRAPVEAPAGISDPPSARQETRQTENDAEFAPWRAGLDEERV